ncbi:MAG: exopolysaccharide biosynthesis protein [Pseudomonadota bacterium]
MNNLQSSLTSLAEQTGGDTVTVSDLLSAVGRRSYGPVLALLGFVMAIGKPDPWRPKRALQFA